jgi:hypothetical protein
MLTDSMAEILFLKQHQYNSDLNELNLSQNPTLTTTTYKTIFPSLQKLKILCLDNNNIGDPACHSLLKSFAESPNKKDFSLRNLSIANNRISDQSSGFIATLVMKSKLEVLLLHRNKIG